MIRMSIALTRLPHLSRSQFLCHWRDVHAPLVLSAASVLRIRKYVQVHGVLEAPDAGSCDGVAEVWYDSLEAATVRHNDPAAVAAVRILREDEGKFINRKKSVVWLGQEHAIFAARP